MNEQCERCHGKGVVIFSSTYIKLPSGGVIASNAETICQACGGTGLRPQEAAKMILASVLKEEARR